ncbi:MAG: SpoIID/LytB domain-containing protein [Anaerolineae bacterium]
MRYPASNAKARALSALAVAFLVTFVLGLTVGYHASSAPTRPTPRSSNLSGRSTDAMRLDGRVVSILTGEPIAGAKIEAGGLITKTDAAGRFHLRLPRGVYDVHAAAPSYIGMTLLAQRSQADREPLLLLEMVPARPTEAEAAIIDQKLLPRRATTGPTLQSLRPSLDFQMDIEVSPRTIRVLMPEGTIVTMDTDQYLRGVVPVEIGPHRPLEALKAQAVAARSYAATRCLPESAGDPAKCEPGLDANVDTTVRTQVYDPVRRYDTTDEAVSATHGVVPRHAGRLIEALFFAHSDGRTRSSEDVFAAARPYLRSVADPAPFDFMHGHGVGMSQQGAVVLADWGATFYEILHYFYRGVTVAPPQPPVLSEPSVSPDTPDSRTPVRFEVTYADPEGDPPAAADVYINGRAHPMKLTAGDPSTSSGQRLRTGAQFAYTTTLQAGTYTYDFHFSDGATEPVSADGGALNVTPATGPTPTSTPPTDLTRDGQWRHSSRLDWLDGQLDGLKITEGTDASLVLGDDAQVATYTSAVLEADFPFIAVGANWQAELPKGTTLDIRVQTSVDGTTWSEWASLPAGDGGRWLPLDDPSTSSGQRWSELAFVRGRLLRFRVTLTSPDPKTLKPQLDGLTLTYIDAPAGPPIQPSSHPAIQPLSHTEPQIITRDEWCTNCRNPTNWPPEYETPTKFIIHHTVSPNDQDGYQAVRAIYAYHANTRGWDDIGYNFLIDNQGRVFEGRYGGATDDGKTVVGGHALQYNYGSIGIALIGTYSEVEPPAATLDTLVDLLITKGLEYDIGPYDEGPLAGTDFDYGMLGHRDVLPGHTVCPGQAAYDLLPDIRARMDAGMAEHTGEETPTPTVTPSPTATLPPGCSQTITNGGFEIDSDSNDEPDNWEMDGAIWTTFAIHSGQRAVFLGLTDNAGDAESTAEVSQSVLLPADAEQTQLTFWYYTSSQDAEGDAQYVELRNESDETMAVVWTPPEPNAGEWREATVDLSPYAGATVQLVFGVTNDGDNDGKTYMRIDDVSLIACGVGGEVTPTPIASGTPTVTLTPTFTPTPTTTPSPTPVPPTPTPGPTATPSPTPANWVCGDLVNNPSFEDGQAFWTIPMTDYPGRITSERAHTGDRSVLVGILDPEEDVLSFSSVWQDLFVRANAESVTLSYWYYPVSLDPEDRQIVEVREPDNENRNRLQGFAGDTSNEQKWLFGQFDLTEHYPGKKIRLYFDAFNRNQDAHPGGVTAMYVDDVSLKVCGPPVGPERAYLPLILH